MISWVTKAEVRILSCAAFDTVDQVILVNDLFALGTDGKVSEWFRTYQKNRKLRVCVNDTLFDECLMKTGGVLQVSM